MNRILLGLVAGFVTFCTVADEPAYTRIDLSNLAADKAITGKDVDGKPAQYNTGGRNRSAVFAFNGAGLSDDLKTHTSSANGTMFMSEAFDNASTKYEFPIYLQVDLGEVKTIDRVTIFNFNMANYAHRGVKDFDLYVSNADEWKTSVAEITSSYTKVLDGTLAKASGMDGQAGETFDLEAPVSARFVAMVIRSQHANDNKVDASYVHYVGLSELVFYTKNGLRDQIIVDNADATGFTAHGTWKTSSSNAHRIGANYLHNDGASSSDNWVEFTPTLETNATYKVSLYWNATANAGGQYDLSRGTNVPVVVTYDGGEMTNVVDMSVVPNGWSELGNWPFTTTGAASVKILTDGVTGRSTEKPAHVIADAVKFAVTDDPITEPEPPETDPDDPQPPSPPVAQLSICCVGDSITEGANGETAANKWTYRLYLPDLLAAEGFSRVDWKGSHVSPHSGSLLPSEGWCGNSAEQIADRYVANAATDKADLLLLHAGHNYDATASTADAIVAAVTNAHARIIAAARAQNPRVVILEAKVITSGKLPKYSYIPALNEAIGVLASGLGTASSPVHVVDMADGWDYTQHCIDDLVHPTESGAQLMAEKWCSAIQNALPETGADRLIEAESFDEKGGWVVDPQFADVMGSPYLLAHGRGVPCADATTSVGFRTAGRVRAWVRTRDWTPDWNGEKPGRFQLMLGGVTFPNMLGVAPETWGWADAGVIDIEPGVLTLALKDLTGFEGRCDAIYLTSESNTTPPPNAKDDLAAWRATMRGETEAPTDVVEADLVVVGGGIAGTAAAIAAADAGLTVAIVQDRPMLGGNASDEIRVRTEKEGHEFHWIVKAIWNTSPNGNSMAKDDTNRANVVAGYTSITPHLNWRAYGAVTDPATKKIVAVDARHTQTGARRRFKGAFFVDTTGDGWVGYWAGARYMLGREAKETFDEPVHGQDAADTSTMGNSLLWTTKTASEPFAFPSVPWATKVSGSRADTEGGWQWEAGLDPSEDTIDDAEMLRDRLFRAIYGSFSNTKAKAGNENLVFNFFGHIAGKRESRRLVGAYVVREKDVISHKPFEDAIGIATWSVDLHRKDGDSGFIAATTHHKYGNWWMPYRSLYSKDVPNLFMAGRCASYSHVAFGSSRVMHAGGQQGVAVGYAASLCKKYDCSPHQVYLKRAYFDELRTLINSRQSEKKMASYVWPEPVVDKEILSVVKDNDDATGVEISGEWATSAHSDTRIGKDYLHNNKVAGEDLWVRYTPDLPVATNYTVSVYWNGDSSRGSAVPIEIVYDGGTTTVTCDMTQNPQDWGALGTWPFKAGTEGSVRILTTGQDGKTVIADAVKFAIVEKVPLGTDRGMKLVVW